MATPVQIKICGVTNANDADACVELGADMIGFNLYRASPRYVEPMVVRRIVDGLPAGTRAVGIFVDADPAEIRKLAKIAGVRCVQLYGHATPESCGELAQEFRVIRAFSTDARFEPTHVAAFPFCDALIDAYHPELRGGTGRRCDWSAARAAMRYTRFLILSGGLDTQNVDQAIAEVTPHAVDVCSGVESAPGVKDHRVLKKFINAVRAVNSMTSASSLQEMAMQKAQITSSEPDEQGHWGRFGGRYVPETLVRPLEELTSEFMRSRADPNFWGELNLLLRDYCGRPTPLFHAQRTRLTTPSDRLCSRGAWAKLASSPRPGQDSTASPPQRYAHCLDYVVSSTWAQKMSADKR
jgi:phosphoribosylanthranilate isomerase